MRRSARPSASRSSASVPGPLGRLRDRLSTRAPAPSRRRGGHDATAARLRRENLGFAERVLAELDELAAQSLPLQRPALEAALRKLVDLRPE